MQGFYDFRLSDQFSPRVETRCISGIPLKAFTRSIKKTKTALRVRIFLAESDDTIPSKLSGTRIGENTRRALRDIRRA